MTPTRAALWRASVIALLSLLVAGCGEDTAPARSARVIVVPGDEPTIQRAVDVAEPGDLVLIETGTYHESVTIETPGIVVRGTDRDGVVLDGEDSLENGIAVYANGVAVENLTLVHYRSNGVLFTGDYGSGSTLEGYRVDHVTAHRNGLYGVYAFGARGGEITDVWASGHPDAGIYIGQCRPCDVVVQRVTAAYNAVGYQGTNAGGGLLVIESTWRNNRVGVETTSSAKEDLAPQHDATIVANLIVDNNETAAPMATEAIGVGVAIGGGTGNRIERNRIERNLGAGVAITDAASYLADGNVVEGNVLGANGIDLLMATRSGTPRGNCFRGNVFVTSSPVDIEARYACAPEAQGGLGEPLALRGGPPTGDIPEPPTQPSMTEVRRLPSGPASSRPPRIDLASLTVPSG